jgi:hypothetical protein
MKYMTQTALITLAIAFTTIFTGCCSLKPSHNYTFVSRRGYPSQLSSLFTQSYTVREDHIQGNLCVIEGAEGYYDAVIFEDGSTLEPCTSASVSH